MIINKKNNSVLAHKVEVADNFLKRLKGLMLENKIEEDYALILVNCNSIHTFFMNFNIDALFLDKNRTVVSIHSNLSNGKIIKPLKHCKYVIEMKAQHINEKIKVGEEVHW